MVKFTINDKEVCGEEGQYILDVAKKAGIEIPTLCHHEALKPAGMCRLCTVELFDGRRTKFVTACNYPIWEGMKVFTDTESIIEGRKLIVELLLARCPDVPVIKDLAQKYGISKPRFLEEGDDCILCGLCVRMCEKMGNSAISFTGRGVEMKVDTPFSVQTEFCMGCGACASVCPTGHIKLEDIAKHQVKPIPSEYDMGLKGRKPIYVPYAQAIPNTPVIDRDMCMHFKTGGCRVCTEFCGVDAIDHMQQDETIELEVGSIILSPGFQPFDPSRLTHYGYGRHPNVMTSMEFERILSASGPTLGHLTRPSDGGEPKKVAWIQCVGSRDENRCNHGYCSSVCCMYAIKEAVIAKEHAAGDLDCAIFFMDMRTGEKEFDRYFIRARDEMGVRFIRSRIHSIDKKPNGSEDLQITYVSEDGQRKTELFDMAVLSIGLEPSESLPELASTLQIELDADGFVKTQGEMPTETTRRGVFACGAAGGPKDIPQSVVDASASAAASAALLADSRNTRVREKKYPEERLTTGEKPRIGVFVCHCGINIGSVVDVPAVRDYAKTLPGVVYAADNLFTCSQDTQLSIQKTIREKDLNRVVAAACTPRTHEPLFQETLREAGLNPYLFEFANIRDQDAWVHKNDPEAATEKAMDLVRMAVSKAALLEPIQPLALDVCQTALVVGGGIAGMNAALNLGNQGFHTYLVEKNEQLGGQARNLSQTWKIADAQKYLARLCRKVSNQANIEVLTGAEIKNVMGFVGNFRTTLNHNGGEKALNHGVVVLATGGHAFDTREYLRGQSDRITCWHELTDLFKKEPERLEKADTVAFIQCVGSREPKRPYCSKICCTASILQAIGLKKQKPSLNVYILYREIRTPGQREHLYREARSLGVVFIRYSLDHKPVVTQVYEGHEEKLNILVKDPILGLPLSIKADYVNLATAILPEAHQELAQFLKVPLNEDGFFMEAHVKLRPVDFSSDGVFVCGLAHYPKSLEESISQAQAAAMRAAGVLARKSISVEPIISVVDQTRCVGCGLCEATCAFGAIRLVPISEKGYRAENNPALCKGCGLCAASCPQKAIDMMHYRDRQFHAAIDAGGLTARRIKTKRAQQAENEAIKLVSGYRLADDRYYHRGHSWVRLERGGRIKVGMDDFMARTFGQAKKFLLPEKGATLGQDRKGFAFRRNGHLATVLSPVTGKVFHVNRKALENPEITHMDPYGEGWLLILEPLIPRMNLNHLYKKKQSINWLEDENRKLLGLLGPEYEKLAATGAAPLPDLFGNFPEIGWDNLVKTFLHSS